MSLGCTLGAIHLQCKAAGPCLKVKNTLPVTPEIISSPITYFFIKLLKYITFSDDFVNSYTLRHTTNKFKFVYKLIYYNFTFTLF
jgi:hypothetical protein